MLLPNKITTFDESVISKFTPILRLVENGDIRVSELYETVKYKTEGVDEFVAVLDCLYALGKIDFNKEEGTIYYVGDVNRD